MICPWLQFLTALTLIALYFCELLLLIHPDGGLPVADVRQWYHGEVGRIGQLREGAGRRTRIDDAAHVSSAVADSVTVLDGGVKTKLHESEMEFYDESICADAELAAKIRKDARYAARRRGTVAHRVFLLLRDLYVHRGSSDFEFESMLAKQKHKACKTHQEKTGSDSCPELPRKDLCVRVYEGSQKTNKGYDAMLATHHLRVPGGSSGSVDYGTPKGTGVEGGSLSSDRGGGEGAGKRHLGGKDMFLKHFEGYAAFVIETTAVYMCLTLATMMTFWTLGFCLGPRKKTGPTLRRKNE